MKDAVAPICHWSILKWASQDMTQFFFFSGHSALFPWRLRCVTEAEFLDIIGTRVLRVFHLAIHSHLYYRILYPPPPPRWAIVVRNWFWNVNIVYRILKSENSQDYSQKSQRNCTFMNSASGKRLFFFLQRIHRDGRHMIQFKPLKTIFVFLRARVLYKKRKIKDKGKTS